MENKPLFFISCPIDTYSGYGARSRDLVRAIIQLDKYDVKILPQMWGNTPWGFINDNPEWEFLNRVASGSQPSPSQSKAPCPGSWFWSPKELLHRRHRDFPGFFPQEPGP